MASSNPPSYRSAARLARTRRWALIISATACALSLVLLTIGSAKVIAALATSTPLTIPAALLGLGVLLLAVGMIGVIASRRIGLETLEQTAQRIARTLRSRFDVTPADPVSTPEDLKRVDQAFLAKAQAEAHSLGFRLLGDRTKALTEPEAVLVRRIMVSADGKVRCIAISTAFAFARPTGVDANYIVFASTFADGCVVLSSTQMAAVPTFADSNEVCFRYPASAALQAIHQSHLDRVRDLAPQHGNDLERVDSMQQLETVLRENSERALQERLEKGFVDDSTTEILLGQNPSPARRLLANRVREILDGHLDSRK